MACSDAVPGVDDALDPGGGPRDSVLVAAVAERLLRVHVKVAQRHAVLLLKALINHATICSFDDFC